jgi:hypothetical protein
VPIELPKTTLMVGFICKIPSKDVFFLQPKSRIMATIGAIWQLLAAQQEVYVLYRRKASFSVLFLLFRINMMMISQNKG